MEGSINTPVYPAARGMAFGRLRLSSICQISLIDERIIRAESG
jgi:hypothetical protein